MNKLTQNDMKILNKYMVDRLAGLLTAIADNNWLHLELLLGYYTMFGTDWDFTDPDMAEIKSALTYYIATTKLYGQVIDK